MKKTIIPLFLAALILSSCGTSKKLNVANAQIQSLDSQVTALNAQNANLNSRLSDCNKQTDKLKSENVQLSADAEAYRKAQAAKAERMENLNQALAEQGTSLQDIKRKAIKAYKEFQALGVDVSYKNGLIYISMGDKLMFQKGSYQVNDLCQQALSVVADVLHDYPHVKAYVVGNTDTVKYKKGTMDNWSLSTDRANAIVRVLINRWHADPAQLISAGRSKFAPIADNSTTEGRAKNRRTDIIINPDLFKVWELMENSQ